MAHKQSAVFVSKVHAIALTIFKHLALLARTGLHPFAIAIQSETVVPDIPETVGIDIALAVITADAQTARYSSVAQH